MNEQTKTRVMCGQCECNRFQREKTISMFLIYHGLALFSFTKCDQFAYISNHCNLLVSRGTDLIFALSLCWIYVGFTLGNVKYLYYILSCVGSPRELANCGGQYNNLNNFKNGQKR